MNLRYWASFIAFSATLHVAFFWPLPAPPSELGKVGRLIVTLPEVPQVNLHAVDHHHPKPALEQHVEPLGSAEIQPKDASGKAVKLTKQVSLPKPSPDEPLAVKSPAVKTKVEDGLFSKVSKEDTNPSISRYRLALAAEVIRRQASIETLVEPDFKGKLVVLVLLRGPTSTPQVSLEQAAGSEHLDREVLAAFRRAAELVPVSIAGDVGEVSIRLPVYFDRVALD